MDNQRYVRLMRDESLRLTEEELKEGWHFCGDWDGLLIHKDSPEAKCCNCKDTTFNWNGDCKD